MSERFDRFDLAGRLEKFGDQLMTLCEQRKAIENRIDVCNQINAVCRIALTLKSLRAEAQRGDEGDAIAGSAVRRYSGAFAAAPRRAISAGSASNSFVDDPRWTDPADEQEEEERDRP